MRRNEHKPRSENARSDTTVVITNNKIGKKKKLWKYRSPKRLCGIVPGHSRWLREDNFVVDPQRQWPCFCSDRAIVAEKADGPLLQTTVCTAVKTVFPATVSRDNAMCRVVRKTAHFNRADNVMSTDVGGHPRTRIVSRRFGLGSCAVAVEEIKTIITTWNNNNNNNNSTGRVGKYNNNILFYTLQPSLSLLGNKSIL